MDRIPYPSPEEVGEILVIPPPPLPPSPPPTPPPITFTGFPSIPFFEVYPQPLVEIPPDVVGAAPEVTVVDTWYQAPVLSSPEIFATEIGGGGGRPRENYDYDLN